MTSTSRSAVALRDSLSLSLSVRLASADGRKIRPKHSPVPRYLVGGLSALREGKDAISLRDRPRALPRCPAVPSVPRPPPRQVLSLGVPSVASGRYINPPPPARGSLLPRARFVSSGRCCSPPLASIPLAVPSMIASISSVLLRDPRGGGTDV